MRAFLRRILPALLLVFVCAGCITQRTIIQVNPDGSGLIAVSRVFAPQTVASIQMSMQQMKTMAESSGGGELGMHMNIPDDPFFNEDQFKREARTYGRGVEFVKAQRMDKDGGRGAAIIYRFKDINQVRVPFGEDGQMMMGGNVFSMMETDVSEDAMEELVGGEVVLFLLERGELNRLRVTMPASMMEARKEAGTAQAAPVAAAAETAEVEEEAVDPEMQAAFAHMSAAPVVPAAGGMGGMGDMSMMPFDMSDVKSPQDMMKKMFAGMRFSVAVEVKGTLVNSTGSLPSAERAGRYTLFDFDMDKVLATGLLDDQMDMMGGGMANPFEELLAKGAVPGISVETNEVIVLEFK